MDTEQLIARYNAAWNAHDPEAIVALHTEDSVFCNHTSGGEAQGREAIRQLVAKVFTDLPDLHFEPRRLYLREGLIVQEWMATATHNRPLHYGGRTLPPTGHTLSWIGVDVMPLRDGRVARKDVYANSLSYLRQIGLPMP